MREGEMCLDETKSAQNASAELPTHTWTSSTDGRFIVSQPGKFDYRRGRIWEPSGRVG